jgi:hypothetical protein
MDLVNCKMIERSIYRVWNGLAAAVMMDVSLCEVSPVADEV